MTAVSIGAGGVTAVADRAASLPRAVLLNAAGWLTTPLLPEDYLGLVNPLWSRGQLHGRVEAVQPETRDAATIVIRPGRGWRGHLAGQHVGVGVHVDGVRRWCGSCTVRARPVRPPHPDHRQGGNRRAGLTPFGAPHHAGRDRRAAAGRGTVRAAAALASRPVFLTAGSGITPVMAMLREVAAQPLMPDTVLVHSAPTRADIIFGRELRDLAERQPRLRLRLHEQYTHGPSGRLTMSWLGQWRPDWSQRESWACGPAGLLEDAERHWRHAGIPERLRLERFRSTGPTVAGNGGRVVFTRSDRAVHAGPATPLLEVGEDAGVLMPSGCRIGICFSCMSPISSGRVRDLRTGREHGKPGELIQPASRSPPGRSTSTCKGDTG